MIPVILILLLSSTTVSAENSIPTDQEYATGSLSPDDDYSLKLGYAWVSTPETSLFSITMYDDLYNIAPAAPFFGQSVSLDDEKYYSGISVVGFEIYEDNNDNEALDQKEEVVYSIHLNASQSYGLSNITKTVEENTSHYTWGVHYGEIDGFIDPWNSMTSMAKSVIDSFNMSFLLSIYENSTEWKVDFEIGAFHAYEFTFDNDMNEVILNDIDLSDYSLSVLCAMTVSSTDSVNLVYDDGSDLSTVKIENSNDEIVFESLMDENYTINNVSNKAYTVIASLDTLPDSSKNTWRYPEKVLTWWNERFEDLSEIPDVPSLDITKMDLLYRICYPTWGGDSIIHDPRLKAYFEPVKAKNSSEGEPTSLFLTPVILGLAVLPILPNKRQ